MAKKSKQDTCDRDGEVVARIEWPRELVRALAVSMKATKAEGLTLYSRTGMAYAASYGPGAIWAEFRVGVGEIDGNVVLPKAGLDAVLAAGSDAVVEVTPAAVRVRAGRAIYETPHASGIEAPVLDEAIWDLEVTDEGISVLALTASLVSDTTRHDAVYVTDAGVQATDGIFAIVRRAEGLERRAGGVLAYPPGFIASCCALARSFGGKFRVGRLPAGALVAAGEQWTCGTGSFPARRLPPIRTVMDKFTSESLAEVSFEAGEFLDALRVAAAGAGDCQVAAIHWQDGACSVRAEGVVSAVETAFQAAASSSATVHIAFLTLSRAFPAAIGAAGKVSAHVASVGTLFRSDRSEFAFAHTRKE